MRQVLLEDPTYVPAWLWMSALVEDTDQQRECLERALALDPNSEPAIRGLKILRLRETAQAKETAEARATAHAPAPADHTAEPPKETQQAPSSSSLEMDLASQRQAGKIGEYLVEQGLITRKQLEMALEEQRLFWKKSQGVRAPLGNILINNGMLTPQMLATALVNQQHDKLHGREKQSPQYVGEYLVSRGLITEQQLEAVLTEQIRLRQKGTTMLLGELLIHAGYITREALETVLEQQRDELFSRFGFED
jgi:hypothetical protein